MLQQGIHVHAFDSEPGAIERLTTRVPTMAGHLLRAEVASFEEASWQPEMDLVFAGYALPFAATEQLPDIWAKLTASIKVDGRFAGHFFGDRDTWAAKAEHTFHLSRPQVRALFTGAYVIEVFDETEKDTPSSTDKMKHWHVFHIIARKVTVSSETDAQQER